MTFGLPHPCPLPQGRGRSCFRGFARWERYTRDGSGVQCANFFKVNFSQGERETLFPRIVDNYAISLRYSLENNEKRGISACKIGVRKRYWLMRTAVGRYLPKNQTINILRL